MKSRRSSTRARMIATAAAVAALAVAWAPAMTGGADLSPGAVLHAQQTPPPGPVQSFRSGVDVVSLTITATDGDSRYVTDLKAGDFSVFEDGVMQDVTFFDHSNAPVALALLLDTSASMEEKLTTAQEAAIGFARRLRPQDMAELVDFDTHVQVLQDFTNDEGLLERAIRKTTAEGSTSLYNAVYMSLQEMKKIRAKSTSEIRRRAIVLLSDGEDTSSLLSFDDVLDLAKRSETAIYAIGARSPEDATVNLRGFNEADFVLKQLTQQTGGRVFFPKHVEELHAIYSQIADELASQYVIGYSSKNGRRDGNWRRIVVHVNRPGVQARTKQGYFAPSPSHE